MLSKVNNLKWNKPLSKYRWKPSDYKGMSKNAECYYARGYEDCKLDLIALIDKEIKKEEELHKKAIEIWSKKRRDVSIPAIECDGAILALKELKKKITSCEGNKEEK